jgi:mannose-6-phosphate isomerase-like protein (cupin superfamily)
MAEGRIENDLAASVLSTVPDVIAPDGSEVRLLCATQRGSMAAFRLQPGAVAKAMAHRTVEEIWYVTAGNGRIWRKTADNEQVTPLKPGVSLTIPVGVRFQFRCDGDAALDILAVTIPPWPGADEAQMVDGKWAPEVPVNVPLRRR